MRRHPRGERGQAMVELALVLPVLLLLLLGIAQFGLIFSSQLTLQNAVREGARIGAVGGDDAAIDNAVLNAASTLDPNKLSVTVSPDQTGRVQGAQVVVSADYQLDLIVPIISELVGPQLNLHSAVTMRVE